MSSLDYGTTAAGFVTSLIEFADGSTASVSDVFNHAPKNGTTIGSATATEDSPFILAIANDAFFDVDVGQFPVTIAATDSWGQTTQQSLVITVCDTNTAPAVSKPLAEALVNQDSVFSYTVSSDAFSDIDVGDSLH